MEAPSSPATTPTAFASQPGSCRARMEASPGRGVLCTTLGRLSPAVAGRGWKRGKALERRLVSRQVSARQLPGEDGSKFLRGCLDRDEWRLSPAVAGRGWKRRPFLRPPAARVVSARQLPGEDGSIDLDNVRGQPVVVSARQLPGEDGSSRDAIRVVARFNASQPGSCRARMEASPAPRPSGSRRGCLSPAVAGRGWKHAADDGDVEHRRVSARQLPGEDGSLLNPTRRNAAVRVSARQLPGEDGSLRPLPHDHHPARVSAQQLPGEDGSSARLADCTDARDVSARQLPGRMEARLCRRQDRTLAASQPGSCRARMEASDPSRRTTSRNTSQPGSCRARMEAAPAPAPCAPAWASQPGSCRARMEAPAAIDRAARMTRVSARQLPGENGSTCSTCMATTANHVSARQLPGEDGSRSGSRPKNRSRAGLSPAVAGRGWKQVDLLVDVRTKQVSARQLPGENGSLREARGMSILRQVVSARQLPSEDGSNLGGKHQPTVNVGLSPAVAGRGWKCRRCHHPVRPCGRLSPAVAGRGWKRPPDGAVQPDLPRVSARQLPGEDGSERMLDHDDLPNGSQPGSYRARVEARTRRSARKRTGRLSPAVAGRGWKQLDVVVGDIGRRRSQPGSCRARMEAAFAAWTAGRPRSAVSARQFPGEDGSPLT